MKEAKMINKHKEKILNWFKKKKQHSSWVVEGLNNKEKAVLRNV